MNERILELADKAIEDMPGAWNIPDEFCKKFAELIVRECAKVLDDKLSNPNGASMAYCDGSDLMEHFGVEE